MTATRNSSSFATLLFAFSNEKTSQRRQRCACASLGCANKHEPNAVAGARPSTQAHNAAWPFRQTLLSSASEYAKSEYAKVHFQKKKLKRQKKMTITSSRHEGKRDCHPIKRMPRLTRSDQSVKRGKTIDWKMKPFQVNRQKGNGPMFVCVYVCVGVHGRGVRRDATCRVAKKRNGHQWSRDSWRQFN